MKAGQVAANYRSVYLCIYVEGAASFTDPCSPTMCWWTLLFSKMDKFILQINGSSTFLCKVVSWTRPSLNLEQSIVNIAVKEYNCLKLYHQHKQADAESLLCVCLSICVSASACVCLAVCLSGTLECTGIGRCHMCSLEVLFL